MNFRAITGFFIAIAIVFNLNGQESHKNILTNATTKDDIANVLLSREEYKPIPLLNDPFWKSLDKETRDYYISRGEKYLNYEWPSLKAVRYMDFDINGNRTNYSDRYFGRRYALVDLCLAEIIENEGRFLDDIINGLWLVLEETTWVVPAHSGGNKLHDLNDVYVDLFSAETAAVLAWIDYYFGEKFDDITPLIRERMYKEVDRRVLQSMLDHTEFWYMGYTGGIPNNWNPWIVSNWLSAVLIMENDSDKRAESVWKALDILDHYLNVLPADGGCDEGPSYWGRAGASVYDCLFAIEQATNGEYKMYHEPLIKNIASYIYKIHIRDEWFVNFADGSANNSHQSGLLYRIGKAMDDPNMMAMAAETYKNKSKISRIPSGGTPFGQRIIPDLQVLHELENFTGLYSHELDYVLPDLEVAVSRQHKNGDGYFTAIKGGFNNESHNHNDAGSFVIFYNGLPLFVDAGVGIYNKKTFSNERYDIWTMQSAYHNLPTLNGYMEHVGTEYKAENFAFSSHGARSEVTMDLSGAYPKEAMTLFWKRNFIIDRDKEEIILTDSWKQKKQIESNQWHFLLAKEPVMVGKGLLKLSNGEQDFYMKYSSHFVTNIEKIDIDDKRLHKVWGDNLWRVTLSSGQKGLKGEESFTIQLAEL